MLDDAAAIHPDAINAPCWTTLQLHGGNPDIDLCLLPATHHVVGHVQHTIGGSIPLHVPQPDVGDHAQVIRVRGHTDDITQRNPTAELTPVRPCGHLEEDVAIGGQGPLQLELRFGAAHRTPQRTIPRALHAFEIHTRTPDVRGSHGDTPLDLWVGRGQRLTEFGSTLQGIKRDPGAVVRAVGTQRLPAHVVDEQGLLGQEALLQLLQHDLLSVDQPPKFHLTQGLDVDLVGSGGVSTATL